MKRRKKLHMFIVMCLALLVVTPSLHYPEPINAQDDVPPDVCALNDFQTTGQEWVYPGSGSGITSDPNFVVPEGVVTLGDFGHWIPDEVTTGDARVLILVVDDFNNPAKSSKNGLTHGQAVLDIVQQVYEQLVPSQPPQEEGDEYTTADFKIDTVNIPGYDLTNIESAIQTKITENPSYDKVVLNMSFAVLPCQIEPFSLHIRDEFLPTHFASDFIAEAAPNWEVLSVEDSGVLENAGLEVSDVITGFDTTCDDYNRVDLWTNVLASMIAEDSLTLCVERAGTPVTPSPQVPALALFKAIRGYSLTLALTELSLSGQTGLTLAQWDQNIQLMAAYVLGYLTGLPPNHFDLTPLYHLLQTSSTPIIPVAAAGNLGRSMPGYAPSLAPGSWDMVISVSGSTANEPTLQWTPSNNGEVMAPALWYLDNGEYIAGTSFAAPAVSVMVALAAAADPNFNWRDCANAGVNNKAYANRPIADVLITTSSPTNGCPQ